MLQMELTEHHVGRWRIIVSYCWRETQNRGANTLFIYLRNLGVPAVAPCAKSAFPYAACLQVAVNPPPICPEPRTPRYLCNYR